MKNHLKIMGLILALLMMKLIYSIGFTSKLEISEVSQEINRQLPLALDDVTTAMRTSTLGNEFHYHYVAKTSKEQVIKVLPDLRMSAINTLCSNGFAPLLKNQDVTVVYNYEDTAGMELASFKFDKKDCGRVPAAAP